MLTVDDYERIDGRFTGKDIKKATGAKTKREAELLLAKIVRDIGDGSYSVKAREGQIRFFEIAEDFLDYSRSRKRSWKKDEWSIIFPKSFFGDVPICNIKLHDIERYISKRQNDQSHFRTPIKPATINRELACLKSIFNRAIDNDLALRNPATKVKFLKENNIRDRVLQPEEFERLVDCAPKHLRPILIIAYHTGMRKNEIVQLTWEFIDLKDGWITLPPELTKTNEKRLIPLNDLAIEAHHSINVERSGRVFKFNGRAVKTIDTAFRNARTRAKLEEFRFHDLRHTFVTNMRRAGKQDRAIMKITGHKTYSMLQRYDTVDKDDLKKVVTD